MPFSGLYSFLESLGYSNFKPTEKDFNTTKYLRFSKDGQKDQDCWFKGTLFIKPNGKFIFHCVVGDHSTGEKSTYKNYNDVEITDNERRIYNDQIKKQDEEHKKEEEKRFKEMQLEAERIWENASTEVSTGYLTRKQIGLCGARIYQGKVVIPVRSVEGVLTGLQFIQEDGGKKFLPGTRKKAGFFTIGNTNANTFYVAEGFATGASLYLAGYEPVFVAFDAGNLSDVATGIRDRYHPTNIVICADNDQWKEKNIGLIKGEEAKVNCNGLLVAPNGLPEGKTDWNDAHCLYGIEEVKRQIDGEPKRQRSNITNSLESLSRTPTEQISHGEDKEGIPDVRQSREPVGNGLGFGTGNGGNQDSGGSGGELKDKKHKKKKISQEEIEALGKEILDCRFKLFIDNQATILFNISNILKKELVLCVNEELLLRRLKQNIFEKTGKLPDPEFVKRVYACWRLSAKPLKETPKSFTWSNEDHWSLKRLDFIPEEGDFPAWKEFLDRLSSPEDFMAFIWSVFEEKNKSRQFLYMYDPAGEGGKTTVIGVLGDVFGNSFGALNNSNTNGSAQRWLLGQLYGKRLAAWGDCKNPKFCMSEIVRNITSNDWVSVELKGENPFSTQMYMKLIIGSNHEPQITSGGADTSRLINIFVKENTKKDDPEWKESLKKELPYFLYECQKIYEAKCPNHGKILLSDSSKERVDSSTESIETLFEDVIERRVLLGDGLETGVGEWLKMCRDEKLDNHQIGNLKDFLKRHYKIEIKRSIVHGVKKTTYRGFHIKNEFGFV